MNERSSCWRFNIMRIATVNISLIIATLTSVTSIADTPTASLQQGSQRVLNSGMESGDVHWSNWTAHTIVISPVHSGNKALQYTQDKRQAGVQHNIPIDSAQDYTISLWSKAETGMKGAAARYFFKNDNNTVLENGFVGEHNPNAGWIRHQAVVTPPDGATKMSLTLLGNNINANLWFDDVSVKSIQTRNASSNTPPIPGDWTLTFQDDFNGKSLDPAKWRTGGHGLGVGISKAGTSGDNIVVRNGNVELIAEKKPMTFGSKHFNYASGEISTFQNFRQTYGYFEAKIKYDAVQGIWPAFWTLPDRGDYGNETINRESFIRFNLSEIPRPVTSALLKVKVTDIETTTDSSSNKLLYNIAVHKLLSTNWNEQNITWNNKPAYDPVWFRQFSGSDDPGFKNEIFIGRDLVIDVTDYVNAQIATNKHAEFALVDNFMKHNKVTFGSKEAANFGDRPRLQIDGNNVFPVDDAYVRAGYYATRNFGNQPILEVQDPFKRTSDTYNGGAEIDIMESQGVWGADTIQQALHWMVRGNPERQSIRSAIISSAPTDDGYHTYGMYWGPDRIEFYIDGNRTDVFENRQVARVSSYILLSNYLGGWDSGWSNGRYVDGFDNRLIRDDLLPAIMYVDHVYVWSGSPL